MLGDDLLIENSLADTFCVCCSETATEGYQSYA